MAIFVTSDLHLGHDKEFLYGPRGFSSSKEHDEAIIKNWNETVGSDDIVYVLGDIVMGADRNTALENLSKLNGQLIVLLGNHDTLNKQKDYLNCPNIQRGMLCDDKASLEYVKIIKSGKWHFYLSHYPTIVANFSDGGYDNRMFCLHGHTHSQDKFQYIEFGCYNIALDAHDNRPVNIEQIKADLQEKFSKA